MKTNPSSVYVLAFFLLALGLGLSLYRHLNFEVPWLPGEQRLIWSIEAKVEFESQDAPVKASFATPDTQPGFERLNERTASPGFGLAFVDDQGGRRAEWSIRQASGHQVLYYQVDMLVNPDTFGKNQSLPPSLRLVTHTGPQAAAAKELLDRARSRSADPFTLARELVTEFNNQAQLAQLLNQSQKRITWLVDLLHQAGVPAREVQVLNLEDGRRRQGLVSYLQVFSGNDYKLFNVDSGEQGQRVNQLIWESHAAALLDLAGGTRSKVNFSIIKQEVPVSRVLREKNAHGKNLLDFSVHSLPLEDQALFKGILLIPVGVLIVVIMRIFVGVRTSGTFMPVLIAMAFIQTSLLPGLIGFVLIVGVGLMIRSYLSRHNLLLVARISTVIISVIILIAIFAILAYRLGLTEGLKITFFPMIILSWTIERTSILWEEEGPKEVFTQVGGSLFVAVLAYAVMSNELVRHLTFNFLGLQFVFMALVLLCGNYTGYRLSELRRFKPLLKAEAR
jgi:hypothetical protein